MITSVSRLERYYENPGTQHSRTDIRDPGARPTDVNFFAGLDALIAGDAALDVSGRFASDLNATPLSGSSDSRWEDTAFRIEGDITAKLADSAVLSAGFEGRFTGDVQDYSANLNLQWEW